MSKEKTKQKKNKDKSSKTKANKKKAEDALLKKSKKSGTKKVAAKKAKAKKQVATPKQVVVQQKALPEAPKKKVVAVTGAEGFLGNNLCRKLIVSGYEVRAMYHNHPMALDGLDVTMMLGDITQPGSLDRLIKGADYVVHCAGSLVMDDTYDELSRPNIIGVQNVVDACLRHGVKRLIHGTSIQALQQEPKEQPLTESRPYVGDEACDYDKSKAHGDQIVEMARAKGLDTIIMVIGGMLGVNDFKPTVSGQFLIDCHREKRPVPSAGGYDWVDVRDVAEAIVVAIEKSAPNEKYILNGQFYTMIELYEIIEKILEKEVIKSKISVKFIRGILPILKVVGKIKKEKPVFTAARLDSLFINANIRHDKASSLLNYNPRPIEVTLRDAYRWFAAKGMLAG